MIQISLNGQRRSIAEDCHLSSLLAELQVNPQKVAVAVNWEVILHSELGNTFPKDGDEIEIIHATGGG